MRRGRGGRGWSWFGLHTPQVAAHGTRTVMQGISRHAKHLACTIADFASPFPQHTPAADVVVRTQPQPGSEMRRRAPSRHIPANFAEKRKGNGFNAWSLCDIHPKELIGLGTQIESIAEYTVLLLSLFLAPFSLLVRWQRLLLRIDTRLKSRQHTLDLRVAGHDSLLAGPIQVARLLQRKQMLPMPVAHQ